MGPRIQKADKIGPWSGLSFSNGSLKKIKKKEEMRGACEKMNYCVNMACSNLNSQFSRQNLCRKKGSVQENLKALGPHFLALRFNFVPNNFAMNLRFLTNFSFFETKDFMDSQMQ